MVLLINRELNEPSTLQGLTARAQRPPLDKAGRALFQAVFYLGKMSIKYQKKTKNQFINVMKGLQKHSVALLVSLKVKILGLIIT